MAVTVVPDFSPNLAEQLSGFGRGLRELLDPGFHERQRTERFLMENPEIVDRMARIQRREDARRQPAQDALNMAAAMAGAPIPEGAAGAAVPDANVLGFRGFDRDQATQLLESLSPGRTQTEILEQERAAAMRRAGEPKARAESTVEQFEAAGEEAKFRGEVFSRISPRLAATARDLEAEREAAYTRKELQALDRVDEIIRESGQEDLWLAFAGEGGQAQLSGLIARERLDSQERIAAMRARASRAASGMNRLEIAEAKFDLMKEIDDAVDRTRQEDLNETELKREIQNVNEMISAYSDVFPRDATAQYATFVNELIGEDVEFESAEGFLGTVANQPELMDAAVDMLEQMRTNTSASPALITEALNAEGMNNVKRLAESMPQANWELFMRDLRRNHVMKMQEAGGEDSPGEIFLHGGGGEGPTAARGGEGGRINIFDAIRFMFEFGPEPDPAVSHFPGSAQ